ncbi:MAG: SDR family NAD(P)-dependent oxidoreductase [Clostridiales bacterium]|nr:SDR family NAD(P)-dependent oxidoreductase [Clostridiales bacterium]
MSEYTEKYGQWSVVCGCSQGIGKAMATEVARRGMNVVLTARSKDKLDALSVELEKTYHVQTKVVPMDLTDPKRVEILREATKDLDVGMLLYNAAVAYVRGFLDGDMDYYKYMLNLNCIGMLELTYYYAERFVRQRRGALVLVGSNAGYLSMPYLTMYSATKGFVLMFASSLYTEMKPYNVDVVYPIISNTETPGMHDLFHGGAIERMVWQDLNEVVNDTFSALGKTPTIITNKKMRRSLNFLRTVTDLNGTIEQTHKNGIKMLFADDLPKQYPSEGI